MLMKYKKKLDEYSRFTDCFVERLVVANVENKHDDVEITVKSKFEDFKMKVVLGEVEEAKFGDLHELGIDEASLDMDGDYYIFTLSSLFSEVKGWSFRAKTITFENESGMQ